jgi:hypothetical protein
MLAEGGLASGSQADFEEEHGIDGDDEETKAVEAGEFCQSAGLTSVKRKQPTSVGTAGRRPSAKRARN